MSSFTRPLKTELLPDGQHRRILQPYRFRFDELMFNTCPLMNKKNTNIYNVDIKQLKYITVPYGFISDGASIPKFVWSIVGSPWTGRYVQAAVVHDVLYHNIGYFVCYHNHNRYIFNLTQKQSDNILLHGCKILGVPTWKRYVIYYGLRVGGWVSWKQHQKHWEHSNKHPLYIVEHNM